MLEKLQAVENRYEELCFRSEQPDFYADPKRAAAFLREKTSWARRGDVPGLQPGFRDMEEAQDLMADPEMRELCQETFLPPPRPIKKIYIGNCRCFCFPKTPMTKKRHYGNRGGVGGEESALFAHSLYRMYAMYAAENGLEH